MARVETCEVGQHRVELVSREADRPQTLRCLNPDCEKLFIRDTEWTQGYRPATAEEELEHA